jgi:hypothetical protein
MNKYISFLVRLPGSHVSEGRLVAQLNDTVSDLWVLCSRPH